jgi:hypothetical protein
LVLVPKPETAVAPLVPPAPPGLLPEVGSLWADFWRSDVSRAVDRDSDMGGLVRWVNAWNEWTLATRALRRVRIVRGSMGQPVLSPLAGYIAQLEVTISRAEEAYGMKPRARAALGLTAAQTRLTVAEVNRLEQDAAVPIDPDDEGGWTAG